MSSIRTVNVDPPLKYHENANYPEDKNNEINKDMDVDIEAISVDGNKGNEVVKLINHLLFLLANGVNLTDKNGASIDKETLTNVLASLSSSSGSKTNAEHAEHNIKSNVTSTTLSELSDTASKRDPEVKVKNKENLDVLQIKPDAQIQKESTTVKPTTMQSKGKAESSLVNKLQTEFSPKNENVTKVAVNVSDGTVQVMSPNGTLSTNDALTVGARGTPMFIDSANEFANDSGFKDSNQSGDQGRQDDRDNEPFDAIYEPGD